MKEIKQETDRPKGNLPYQDVNRPFRMQFVVPGPGITIEQDKNGVLYISAQGGSSVSDIIAGDNIEIDHREDGSVVISAVNSVANISAGENVTITVDPETGASVINSIIGGETNEHYKGVFDTTEDLIAADPEPEIGDYGLIKSLTITNGETSWSGQYKYCFYINGAWTVVDQMLTFTKNLDLLQQYYSVGGSSPVIYLHEIARSGNFWDLNNIPIVATPEVTVEGTTVTVTCATEGAEIWYTTDGSMPHVNGTKYTGPITVSEATSFRFVGIKNGMINSLEAVASADYELQAPVIELDWHTGEITMTNPNEDGNGDQVGTIYYTTDGTTPTNESMAYAGPFVIDRSTNFKAIVISGANSSSITNAVFVQSIFANMYGQLQSTTGDFQVLFSGIGNGTFADEIHYTTDGSEPDYQSDSYSSPITFPYFGHTVLKYRGYTMGRVPSAVASHEYGIGDPEPPVISFNADSSSVTLSFPSSIASLKQYCKIYYSLDGSTPTDQSTLYTGPFQLSGNVTVKAVLVAYGQYYSDVATENITVLAPPQISFGLNVPTTFDGLVTLTNPNNAGEIRYTTDGSTPTAESPLYSSVIHLTDSKTVKAVVVSGGAVSAVAEQTFTQLPAAKTGMSTRANTGQQTISVQPQSYNGRSVDHWINLVSDGQEVFPYIQFDESFSQSEMCKFAPAWSCYIWSVLDGYIPKSVPWGDGGRTPDSPVIHYREETSDLLFELGVNTSTIPLQTNNNTPEIGCRVYYTLDGSTPTAQNGTLWDGNPVSVKKGDIVKAVVVCYGNYSSTVVRWGCSDYLKFTAEENESSVILESTLTDAPVLEISRDNGRSWQNWSNSFSENKHVFETVNLAKKGDSVLIRGINKTLGVSGKNSHFLMTGKISAHGSITSMLDGEGISSMDIPSYCFIGLFKDNTSLTAAAAMSVVASIGISGCYCMYQGCTSLTAAADMSGVTSIRAYGCQQMYQGCTSLTAASDMSGVTNIGEGVCYDMYKGCTLLTAAADMSGVTSIGAYGCNGMYEGCTSLTAAADMSGVTSIGNGGCRQMYKGCTSLTAAADMSKITSIGSQGCYCMYQGCTSLTAAADMSGVTSIGDNGCYCMYQGCTSLTAAADMSGVTSIGAYGCNGMYKGCTLLTAAADMSGVTSVGAYGCQQMYQVCTSLTSAANMSGVTSIGNSGCHQMYQGCLFNMSDNGSDFNFNFPQTPITTTGSNPTTYNTDYDVAVWMGNTHGFSTP